MQISIRSTVLALAAAATLSACSETTSNTAPPPMQPAMRTGSVEDENACLRAVTAQTQNSDVTVLSSEFSEANTLVMIGVGPNRAKWRCLVSGGNVGEVMSMTDEGAL